MGGFSWRRTIGLANNKLREKPPDVTPILYVTDDFEVITREAVPPVITLRRTVPSSVSCYSRLARTF